MWATGPCTGICRKSIGIEDQNHGGSSYFHNGKLVDITAYDEEQIIIVQTNVRCANLTSDEDSTKDRIN